MYIEKVNSPADVKKLSVSEMNGLGGDPDAAKVQRKRERKGR